MNSRIVLFAALCLLASASILACHLDLTNDTNKLVVVTDLDTNTKTALHPRMVMHFEDKHQYFSVEQKSTDKINSPRIFIVKQHTCSTMRDNKMTVSDIMKSKVDKSLFTVTAMKKRKATSNPIDYNDNSVIKRKRIG